MIVNKTFRLMDGEHDVHALAMRFVLLTGKENRLPFNYLIPRIMVADVPEQDKKRDEHDRE